MKMRLLFLLPVLFLSSCSSFNGSKSEYNLFEYNLTIYRISSEDAVREFNVQNTKATCDKAKFKVNSDTLVLEITYKVEGERTTIYDRSGYYFVVTK